MSYTKVEESKREEMKKLAESISRCASDGCKSCMDFCEMAEFHKSQLWRILGIISDIPNATSISDTDQVFQKWGLYEGLDIEMSLLKSGKNKKGMILEKVQA